MQGRGKVLSLITEYKKRWQCYVPQKFYKEYINQYVKHIKHRLLLFLDNSSGDVAMTDVNITLTLKKVSPEMRLRKSSIPLDNKEGKWSASGPRGRGWSEKEDSGNESGQFSIRFILSSASSILPHYHLFSSAYKLIQVLTGCGDTKPSTYEAKAGRVYIWVMYCTPGQPVLHSNIPSKIHSLYRSFQSWSALMIQLKTMCPGDWGDGLVGRVCLTSMETQVWPQSQVKKPGMVAMCL